MLVRKVSKGRWITEEMLLVCVEDQCVTVPTNFLTDLASIPSIFHAWLPPDDPRYASAAIVHDYLYCSHPLYVKYQHQADWLFFQLMIQSGTPIWLALLLYIGVRLGGWVYWVEADLQHV